MTLVENGMPTPAGADVIRRIEEDHAAGRPLAPQAAMYIRMKAVGRVTAAGWLQDYSEYAGSLAVKKVDENKPDDDITRTLAALQRALDMLKGKEADGSDQRSAGSTSDTGPADGS